MEEKYNLDKLLLDDRNDDLMGRYQGDAAYPVLKQNEKDEMITGDTYEIYYEHQGALKYLVISIKSDKHYNDRRIEILPYMHETNALPLNVQYKNDRVLYYYEVGLKAPLSQFLASRKLNAEQFIHILLGVVDVLKTLNTTDVVFLKNVLLDQDYIFVDSETLQVSMVHIPLDLSLNQNLKRFMIKLVMFSAQIEDDGNKNIVTSFFDRILTESYDVERLKEILHQVLSELKNPNMRKNTKAILEPVYSRKESMESVHVTSLEFPPMNALLEEIEGTGISKAELGELMVLKEKEVVQELLVGDNIEDVLVEDVEVPFSYQQDVNYLEVKDMAVSHLDDHHKKNKIEFDSTLVIFGILIQLVIAGATYYVIRSGMLKTTVDDNKITYGVLTSLAVVLSVVLWEKILNKMTVDHAAGSSHHREVYDHYDHYDRYNPDDKIDRSFIDREMLNIRRENRRDNDQKRPYQDPYAGPYHRPPNIPMEPHFPQVKKNPMFNITEMNRPMDTSPMTAYKKNQPQIPHLKEQTAVWRGNDRGADDAVSNQVQERQYPYLEFEKDGHYQKVMIDKQIFLLGRQKEKVDLVIQNNAVGRIHAEIVNMMGKYYIKDLNSKNGTFVNGNRVEANKEYKIKSNDKIMVANSVFIFIIPY